MSGPGARKGLAELIPASAPTLQPKPARERQAKVPPPAGSSPTGGGRWELKHDHWSWEPIRPLSCPACIRNYGPGSAIALVAGYRGLSVEEWLREAAQRRRDEDPWLREITGELNRIQALLQQP